MKVKMLAILLIFLLILTGCSETKPKEPKPDKKEVVEEKLIDIGDAKVLEIEDQEHTGDAITPSIIVTMNELTLVEATDYKVEYDNNVEIGEATIKITGIGAYTGTKEVKFQIVDFGPTVKLDKIVISPIEEQTYLGEEIKPTPEVKLNGKTLVKDQDYYLTYKNNINVGTATLIVNGKRNYVGSKSTSFAITKAHDEITIVAKMVIYDTTTIDAEAKAKSGEKVNLTYYSDPTCKVKAIPSNVGTYYAIGSTPGNSNFFSGTSICSNAVIISQANISNVVVSQTKNYNYTSKEITPNPELKMNNKTLVKDVDYTLTYKDNIEVGVATIIVTGKGNYTGTIETTFRITR